MTTRNMLWLLSKGRDVEPKDYYAAIPLNEATVAKDTGAFELAPGGKVVVDADGGGLYLAEFAGRFARNGTGTYRQLNLAHNGASVATATKEGPFIGDVRVDMGATVVAVELAPGDVLQLEGSHDADVTLRVTGSLKLTAL